MSLFEIVEKAAYSLINGKRTIDKPIFVKDFSYENNQLNDLVELSKKIRTKKKELIERDIAFLTHGLDGEHNVYYELKNSFIPMLCLHDIRLEYDVYVAQLDFIIITNKFIYVLETKKLNGDIEITKDGDFIRTFKTSSGKAYKKEGMYSPISQNERHINILKEILTKENLVKTLPIRSAVVIANPKSILNKVKCPKSIQNNIYKYDQINNLLRKELNDKNIEKDCLEKYSYAIADYLIKHNKPVKFDNIAKYSLEEIDFIKENTNPIKSKIRVVPIEEITIDPLPILPNTVTGNSPPESYTYILLKNYRLNISRQENIKAYMVFNNRELDELIQVIPKTKQELLSVKGFGEKKVKKYGDEILRILNE